MNMDKEEAINCIQDLIDVANFRGSSYVHKHNGGVDRLENVLDCLKNSEPVVHAHWEYDPHANDWGIGGWCCSKCHFKNDILGVSDKLPLPIKLYAGVRYCAQCGAKMDEVMKE